jgi:NAD(P)-dependent dehydrogenase (short-subunit alcohol dehydrogenase family)
MGRLDGRVAIITGAGRGMGRAHALYFASEGAAVVVNDLGSTLAGNGADLSPGREVVAEIEALGGRAVASGHDVASWSEAEELVALAVEAFGRLDVLVNNAGIVRDRTLFNLTEEDWDRVIHVHLKGHAAMTRHAMSHWRSQAKSGKEVRASIVHTTSVAGFVGNFGQANYSAAKAGIQALSQVAAIEGAKHGVRSNAVSPSGRTRLTSALEGSEERLRVPEAGVFDYYAPENVSPLIGWLAEADCPANNQVFHIGGSRLFVLEIPKIAHLLENDGRWTPTALDRELSGRVVEPVPLKTFFPGPGDAGRDG